VIGADKKAGHFSALSSVRQDKGDHSDKDGKITIYPVGSADYRRLSADENIRHIKAMRSGGKG